MTTSLFLFFSFILSNVFGSCLADYHQPVRSLSDGPYLLNLSCCSLLAFNSGKNFSNSSLFFASRDLDNTGRDISSKEGKDLISHFRGRENVSPHLVVVVLHDLLLNQHHSNTNILLCCLGNQLYSVDTPLY